MKAFQSIKRVFTEKVELNVPVLLICFVISCFIYYVYRTQTLRDDAFSVNLEIRSSNGIVAAGPYRETVQVIVRGSPQDVSKLSAEDFTAYLNLDFATKKGVCDFPVLLELTPRAMEIISLQTKCSPSHIKLEVEEEASAFVPVEPLYSGKPADGYELKSVSVEPPQVEITGARSLVLAKSSFQTKKMSIDGALGDFITDTGLNDKPFSFTYSEDVFRVKFEIVPVKVSRKIDVVKVSLANVPPSLDVVAQTDSIPVTIYGNMLDVEKFVPAPGTVVADCSKVSGAGRFDVPVTITVPPQFSLTGEVVKKVPVTFNTKPVADENKSSAEEPTNDEAGEASAQ
ncbi:YbbR-like domain-containing protein [Treponema saccharophilum]|uniref:CdaR family protein n=1 Tax=Treponema saccharophilum TaxID=165 RepID=UPI0038673967